MQIPDGPPDKSRGKGQGSGRKRQLKGWHQLKNVPAHKKSMKAPTKKHFQKMLHAKEPGPMRKQPGKLIEGESTVHPGGIRG